MRLVTTHALAAALASLPAASPRVVASGNFATPHVLIDLLDEAVPSYRLFMLNAQGVLPDRAGVVLETPFVGPAMRGRPGLDYLPARLSLVPRLFATSRSPDVVLLHTSTPRGGTVSLGVEVNILPAAIEAVRARGGLVVAQMNSQMPYTYGDGQFDVDEIDLAIEVDEPLASPVPRAADDVTRVIGDRVAELVSDGATLQLGIGGVPDATLAALHSHRGLRVWSEMISDGVLALEKVGALDAEQAITTSFIFGSPALYAFVDANPRIRVLRTEKTNDPSLIARQPAMTSVNTALQVDLFAQANASRVRGQVYSGFGGQTDFIVGALHSPGGQAIVALQSWHPKADVSTIVPLIDGPVTSFQHTVIATEQGLAPIWGRSQRAQARLLIERAAHPDARAELWEAAGELGLIG